MQCNIFSWGFDGFRATPAMRASQVRAFGPLFMSIFGGLMGKLNKDRVFRSSLNATKSNIKNEAIEGFFDNKFTFCSEPYPLKS